MELRHLRYFVAAAEELNFRRAAARLHIAQPALSVQIHQLEAEIGAKLFVREGRGIQLTPAGLVFLDRARNILTEVRKSVALTLQAANGEIGHLSIGHNGPAELLLFPSIIPALKAQWPSVHLAFDNLRTPQQLERLRRDDLDLAFVWLPVPTKEFDVLELMSVSLVAVLPANHPLAAEPEVLLTDLSAERLILFSRNGDWESFQQVERLFSNAGGTLNIAHESENLLSVLNFVSMGSGYSLLPNYSSRIAMDGVIYKPIKPCTVVKTLAVIKKKDRMGLTDAFYHFLADRFANGAFNPAKGAASSYNMGPLQIDAPV